MELLLNTVVLVPTLIVLIILDCYLAMMAITKVIIHVRLICEIAVYHHLSITEPDLFAGLREKGVVPSGERILASERSVKRCVFLTFLVYLTTFLVLNFAFGG